MIENKKSSEAVRCGDGLVTVSVGLERLKLDFLREASSRGLNSSEVESLVANLRFYFDKREFCQHTIAGEALPMRPWLEKLFTLLDSFDESLGCAYIGGKTPAIYLSLANMVKHRAGSNNVVRLEVTEAAMIQSVYVTWRHERDHILMLLDPQKLAEYEKMTMWKSVVGLVCVPLTYFSLYLLHPEMEYDLTKLLAAGYVSLAASRLVTGVAWYWLWDGAEKAARIQGETGTNLSDIFEFEFEKQPDAFENWV